MENFEIINKLGTGGFSKVYKVRRKQDNQIYAFKKVQILNLSEKQKQNCLNEIRVLASIKNKYIVNYKEAFLDPKDSTLCLVMEYADKGDLYNRIKEQKKRGKYFNERDIWRIFLQLIKGLKSLHDLNIVHRDIKSSNIFLFSDGTAKLGDLNVCKILSTENNLTKTQAGTPSFAAPEVWMEKPYGLKSDIWSLGCVLYEIVTLKCPFRAQSLVELYNKILIGEFNKIPKKFSQELNFIIGNMIKYEPEKRMDCDNILKYGYNFLNKDKIESDNEDNIINDENKKIIIEENKLLETIYIPNNLIFLNNQLPKPNYSQEIRYSYRKNNLKPIKIKSDLNLLNINQNKNYVKYNSDTKILYLSNAKRFSQDPKLSTNLNSLYNNDNLDLVEKKNKNESDVNKSTKSVKGPIKLKKLHSNKSLTKILNINSVSNSEKNLNNKINLSGLNNIKLKEDKLYEKEINDLNNIDIKKHHSIDSAKLNEILHKKKRRKSHGLKKDIKFILKVKNKNIDNNDNDNINYQEKINININNRYDNIANEYKQQSTETNVTKSIDNNIYKYKYKCELSPIKSYFKVKK